MRLKLKLEWYERPDGSIQLQAKRGGHLYVMDRDAKAGSEGEWVCEVGRIIGKTQTGQIITIFPIRPAGEGQREERPVPADEAGQLIAQALGAKFERQRPRVVAAG